MSPAAAIDPRDHTGYVLRTAWALSNTSGYDVNELVAAGYLGMAQAMAAYEPRDGAKFLAFAAMRIRGAMIDEMRRNDWLSRSERQRLNRLRAARRALLDSCSHEPDVAELAAALGWPAAEVEEVLRSGLPPVSLDWREEEPDEDLGAWEWADPAVDVEGEAAARAMVVQALAALPERERRVITALYGEDRRQVDLARELNVSPARVKQLRDRALERMRRALEGRR